MTNHQSTENAEQPKEMDNCHLWIGCGGLLAIGVFFLLPIAIFMIALARGFSAGR